MPALQDIIHKVDVAIGPKYIRYALVPLVVIAFLLVYNLRVTKNFGTQEAMDSAQLARNIAEGKGFTTSFIRPFSLHLISERNRNSPTAGKVIVGTNTISDPARIKSGHPDISNAPLYPVVLAGAMKVLPVNPEMTRTKPFWSSNGRFWRFQPDFLIAWFNQLLFVGVIALTYRWARKLFDPMVAFVSALLLFGSELLWRFSSSGLPTILLMLIFMGIVWGLTLLQDEVTEPKRGWKIEFGAVLAVGLLIGAASLTRYGFGWLILPAVVFVALFGGRSRVPLALLMAGAFTVVLLPWIFRNWNVSGTLFGTAGFDLFKGASLFPEHRLDRSLDPNIQYSARAIWMKLLINARVILQSEFFGLAGGWALALFVVGWMIGFRNPVIRRMRYFLVASMGVLFVAQALGRTQISEDSPILNSENYLVVLVPLITVYAVSLFFMLLDQIAFPVKPMRHVVTGVLVAASSLPLLFALLPPRGVPVAYPPYYPPAIHQTAELFRETELLMSDVPWAMAWYGKRDCVWLTLNAFPDRNDQDGGEDFFAINDLMRTIYGVYLTPVTMNMPFETGIVSSGDSSWGGLIIATMLMHKDEQGRMRVPAPFPLRELAPGYLPEQMLFTDWKRWAKPE